MALIKIQFTIDDQIIQPNTVLTNHNLLTKYSKLYNNDRSKAKTIISENIFEYKNLLLILSHGELEIILENARSLLQIYEMLRLADLLEIKNMNIIENEEFMKIIKNDTFDNCYSWCFELIEARYGIKRYKNILRDEYLNILKNNNIGIVREYFNNPNIDNLYYITTRFTPRVEHLEYFLLNAKYLRCNDKLINVTDNLKEYKELIVNDSNLTCLDYLTVALKLIDYLRYVRVHKPDKIDISRLFNQNSILINHLKPQIINFFDNYIDLPNVTSEMCFDYLKSYVDGKLISHIFNEQKDLFTVIILTSTSNKRLWLTSDVYIFKNNKLSPSYKKYTNGKIEFSNNHKILYDTYAYDTNKFYFNSETIKQEFNAFLGISGRLTKCARS